jgi:hypothetical protein
MHSGDIGIDETDVVRGQQFLSAGVQRMLGMDRAKRDGAALIWDRASRTALRNPRGAAQGSVSTFRLSAFPKPANPG